MAMALTVQVERSLVPGLSRIPITRCPFVTPTQGFVGAPVFEPSPVELVGAADAGVPDADLSVDPDAAGVGAAQLGGAATVGSNIVIGGLYGACSRLLQPGIARLMRRAGPLAPAVRIAGEAGAFGLAVTMAGLLKDNVARIGAVVMRVPFLGSTGMVGCALQFGVGSHIGQRVAALLVPDAVPGTDAAAAPAEQGLMPVFLANLCVMCNAPYELGSGQSVAALSCGHACMCNRDDGGSLSCVQQYLQCRSDCPLCRMDPVHVLHEITV